MVGTARKTARGDEEPRVSYALSRFNAIRHGILSEHTVLPWEDAGEYHALLSALVEEHRPQGPTEEHLVEELAGIVWRKRRLRLAEAALARDGLRRTARSLSDTGSAALVCIGGTAGDEAVADALRAGPEDTERDREDLESDQAMTERALTLLKSGGAGAYDKALAALREDTREWWHDQLAREPEDDGEEEPYAPDGEGLLRFLETEVGACYAGRREQLDNRAPIRSQALGEAYDPARLAGLARYEVHLDRKLERTLAILVKLRQLRRDETAHGR